MIGFTGGIEFIMCEVEGGRGGARISFQVKFFGVCSRVVIALNVKSGGDCTLRSTVLLNAKCVTVNHVHSADQLQSEYLHTQFKPWKIGIPPSECRSGKSGGGVLELLAFLLHVAFTARFPPPPPDDNCAPRGQAFTVYFYRIDFIARMTSRPPRIL